MTFSSCAYSPLVFKNTLASYCSGVCVCVYVPDNDSVVSLGRLRLSCPKGDDML